MRLSNLPPFVPLGGLDRLRLRRAALRYARHGWAVAPGAWAVPATGARAARPSGRDGHRYACDRPGCPTTGRHPAIESWEDEATTDPVRVAGWWRRRPHAVLLVTGATFDVLEVPAALALRMLGGTQLGAGMPGGSRWTPGGSRWNDGVPGDGGAAGRGPVAATPDGRWMFLVGPGEPLRGELARRLDVIRHGHGSWVPAAPTRTPEGAVRWVVPPERTQWSLPDPVIVQARLVDALGSRPAFVVPRQVSTARRAA